MARRRGLGDVAKILGGLGAAYLASGYIRPGVQPEDVNPAHAAQDAIDREKRYAARTLKKGGSVSSASKRADGCAQRGKTRGKMV